MAFAVTARQSGNNGQTAGQTLTTDSATPTANALFLAFAAALNDNHSVDPGWSSISGGSLSYTQIASIENIPWDGSAFFALGASCWRAPVGSSPSAFTVTVDPWTGTEAGNLAVLCLDITGHDDTSPIVQSATNGADGGAGDSVTGTVTLTGAPAVGNLVVVSLAAGADNGGGFATPTIGGQVMTVVFNQDASFCQASTWYRVIDGTETDNTITCTDVGDTVGNWTAVAVEIAAGAATVTDLDGTNTTQAQSATAAALTQTHELAADSASQAQSATAAALTQVHELAPASAVQAQTATQAAVEQGVTLTPANAVQPQAATTAALSQVHELTAADALQTQQADAAALTQLHELLAADAVQAQDVALPALSLGLIVTPPERTLIVSAESRVLTVAAESRIRIVPAEDRRLVVT